MNLDTKRKMLLLENEPAVREKIQRALENNPLEIICFSSINDALKASKTSFFDLVITGHNDEIEDPVDVVKKFVMASPMTSIIMVTDLSPSEVDEKAEGYGILGNISRKAPAGDLLSLLGAYEEIQQSIKQK